MLVYIYQTFVFISRAREENEEKRRKFEREKSERRDSKRVGAHNFLSSSKKTVRKRHQKKRREKREKIQVLEDKTKGEQTKNKKKREFKGELYLYSLKSRAFVYILSIHTHTKSPFWKKKKRYGENNNARKVAVIRGGSAVNAEKIK